MIGGWSVSGGRMAVNVIAGAVPAGARYISGAAYDANGARYTINNAAPAGAVILDGIAHTSDGAMYSATTGTVFTMADGLPLNAAGVVLRDNAAAIQNWQSGYPFTSAGYLATT